MVLVDFLSLNVLHVDHTLFDGLPLIWRTDANSLREINSLIVRQGIPQRFIPGPLLFIVFINGLPLYVTSSRTDLYADDTTLTSSTNHSSIGWLEGILNSSITKSSIGQLRTNYQLMKVKPRLCSSLANVSPQRSMKKWLKGTELELVAARSRNWLWTLISFPCRETSFCKKLSQRIGVLKKIRSCLLTKQTIVLSYCDKSCIA